MWIFMELMFCMLRCGFSFGNFRFGIFVCDLLLQSSGFKSFVWELSFGVVRLRSSLGSSFAI
jgi:hypothetical protein